MASQFQIGRQSRGAADPERSASLRRAWDSTVTVELPCRSAVAQYVIANAGSEAFDTFGCEATGRQRLDVGSPLRGRRGPGFDGDCRTNRMQRTPR